MSSQIIAQPGGQQATLTRESYLAICDGDFCAARLLNAMERWHAYKLTGRKEGRAINKMLAQGGQEPSHDEGLWIRMAIDPKDGKSLGWRAELLNEYSYKIVERALKLLLEKGYCERRENPKQNWDRTPQWLFKVEAVQGAVDEWGAGRGRQMLSEDPDGMAAPEEAGGYSADSTDCTRQICRVETAEVPSQVGRSAEAITQESFTGIKNKKTTPEAPQPSPAETNSFAANAAGVTPQILETETQTPPQLQVGRAQGAASGEAGGAEQAGPVQDQTEVQASGGPNRPTDVQDVPPASPAPAPAPVAAGHWVMVDALRAAVYPGVAQAAPKLETRLGGAAKQLLAAGLGLDAPAGILALIRSKHTWRKSITPETVVEHSAEWQSAQASMPVPGAEQPVAAPAAPTLGCQPGERRADPSGAVWTVETVAYGQVVFEEVAAPRDLPVAVVASWAVRA